MTHQAAQTPLRWSSIDVYGLTPGLRSTRRASAAVAAEREYQVIA